MVSPDGMLAFRLGWTWKKRGKAAFVLVLVKLSILGSRLKGAILFYTNQNG
jgi:hypothetical protein